MRGFLCALMLLASPLSAQQWNADTSDDGGYAAGIVRYPGLDMGLFCAARSAKNKPLHETSWIESDVAPAYQFMMTASAGLIPNDVFERSDIVLVLDQTGYRLPTVGWNEMAGEWQVNVSMTDQMMTHLRRANRLVLQIGSQAAWELPTVGLGAALDRAQEYCVSTWSVTGYNAPQGIAVNRAAPQAQAPIGQFTIPPQVAQQANLNCNGQASIAPDAMEAGDLDNDGVPDVLLNYRDVTCLGERFNPNCGAANCLIEVFLSSRGYSSTEPMLGTVGSIVPHSSGRLALQIIGTYGLCGETGCDLPWLWTGTTFEQRP